MSAPLLRYGAGGLEMDGVPLAELAARHGTPFFLFSERRLLDNFHALRRGLGAAGVPVTLRYCAKANHEAGVLALLAAAGSALLASHLAEVELALACGFPAARISYQRPAPAAAEVAAAVAAGVGFAHLFRPDDVPIFAAAAERHGRALRLSLRLRDERAARLSPLAALNRRLGLSWREAREVALALRSSRHLRVVALNVYVGTQQPSPRGFDRALHRACALARELAAEGVEIEEINLGGGIPSPTLRRVGPRQLLARWRDRPPGGEGGELASGGDPARLEAFARGVAERYAAAARAAGLARLPGLAAEPGRSIAGNAAVLVTRVAAAEGRWLFLDASRNFLGESPLLLSRRILPVRAPGGGRERHVHLSGSTLNTMDVLDLRRRLPPVATGELLALCDAGAYSLSRASRYAGMTPAVLLAGRDGTVRAIRRPEEAGDLMAPMEPALGGAATRGARRG